MSALSADDVFPDLLSDMKGYNFTVAALSWFPFVWKRNGRHEGTEMQMLEYLASQLNFTCAIKSEEVLNYYALKDYNSAAGTTSSSHLTVPGAAPTPMAPGLD